MADTTANYNLSYPESTDAPEVWTDMQNLAEDVDGALDTLEGKVESAASKKPVGRLVQAVAQTGITNNTMTAVTFTTEELDTGGFHSTSVNTSRVTPTVAGVYRVHGAVSAIGQVDYASVEVAILVNATAVAPATRFNPGSAGQTTVIQAEALVTCNGSTDYFGVGFRLQRASATSGTVVSSQFASVLEWERIRD